MLPLPGSADAPLYWRNEASVLPAIVTKFINGELLTLEEIGSMRSYLTQWIDAPGWRGGEELAELRRLVRTIRTNSEVREWVYRAVEIGADPL